MVGAFSDNDSLVNAFCNKMSCTRKCQVGLDPGKCWHNGITGYHQLNNRNGLVDPSTTYRFMTADGFLISTFISPINGTTCSYAAFQKSGSFIFCGIFMVDVNGFKPPNKAGRDILGLGLTKYDVYPRGADGDSATPTCDPTEMGKTGQGNTCASRVMKEGGMNY